MAGSRREYLAADKPKIYITVKLSSVTHACRGSDPDDRPKFNVAIIYEDNAAGKRAKHFYDRVIRELADECDFSLELWNFQVLAVPEIGNSAAKAAAQADFVILSMHRKAQLPGQTRDWIERWSELLTDNVSFFDDRTLSIFPLLIGGMLRRAPIVAEVGRTAWQKGRVDGRRAALLLSRKRKARP